MALRRDLKPRPTETTLRDYLVDHGIVSVEVDRVDEDAKACMVYFREGLTNPVSDTTGAVEL